MMIKDIKFETTKTIIETKRNTIVIQNFNNDEIICIQTKPKSYEEIIKCQKQKRK